MLPDQGPDWHAHADAQLLVSVREIRVWSLLDVLIGLAVMGVHTLMLGVIKAVIGVALTQLGARLRPAQAIAFALTLALGALLLTFLVPVDFAVTVPAEALTGRLTLPSLALAAAVAADMLLVARIV